MKGAVIFSNLIFSVIGIASVFLAIAALMLFDAPGSENNLYTWGLFFSSIALPFSCLASVLYSSYVCFNTHNYKKAFCISLLPLIFISTSLINIILLQIYCHGLLACH